MRHRGGFVLPETLVLVGFGFQLFRVSAAGVILYQGISKDDTASGASHAMREYGWLAGRGRGCGQEGEGACAPVCCAPHTRARAGTTRGAGG